MTKTKSQKASNFNMKILIPGVCLGFDLWIFSLVLVI
jgi:hypothetical protein